MIKKYALILVLLIVAGFTSVTAQSISSQMIGTTGGFFKSDGVSISFSTGELVTGAFEGETIKLIQGFSNNYSQVPTSVENPDEFPNRFSLSQNFPNPFNPSTVIRYQVPVTSDVQLEVFDMLGRKVATLVNSQIPAGLHEVRMDAGHLASGIYVYRLIANGQVYTRQMTLIK